MAVASNWQMLMDRLLANRTRPDLPMATGAPPPGSGGGFAGVGEPAIGLESPSSGEAGPSPAGGPGPISDLGEATAAFPDLNTEDATIAAINQNSFESNAMQGILGLYGMVSPTPLSLAFGLMGQGAKMGFNNANQTLTESLVDMASLNAMSSPKGPTYSGFMGEEEGENAQGFGLGGETGGFGTIGTEGYGDIGAATGEPSGPGTVSAGVEGYGDIGAATGDVGIGGGGGTGDSGGTVICTELARQGILPADVLALERRWASTVPWDVYVGYRTWADPVVRWMKRSPIVTEAVAVLAKPFIYHVTTRPNLIGRLFLPMGMAICGAIGRRRRSYEDPVDLTVRGWLGRSVRSS